MTRSPGAAGMRGSGSRRRGWRSSPAARGCALGAAAILAALCAAGAQDGDTEWTSYGGDGGMRYSPLKHIRPGNVGDLQPAWTFNTGELRLDARDKAKAAFEATPLMVDQTLFVSTPFGRVFALDPRTGLERWRFDPGVDRQARYSEVTSRGVSTWLDARAGASAPCRRRIFVGTLDARLLAIDARDGSRCAGFGANGQVDLKQGVRVFSPADYQVTSPPAVVRDLVVVGTSIGDNRSAELERGVVRAFDARTGRQRWAWDPLVAPSDARTGAANAWSVLTADDARDLVFVPTGSPSPDFYGGVRPGDNRHANAVAAIRASTGALVWSFQVVHHDLWDYDVASQPVLATVTLAGRAIPAVIVGTKMGHLFVLDRETGVPVFPVEERTVPASDVPGERISPTQPFPAALPPLAPQGMSADRLWGATDEDRAYCRTEFSRLKSGPLFTPPSVRGTIVFPGNVGGTHWGGVAFDPVRQRIVGNTNRLASVVRLIPREQAEQVRTDPRNDRLGGEYARQDGTPYAMYRHPFATPRGLPCTAPPWGALTAVDLGTGRTAWERPLGITPEAAALPGSEAWGSLNLGGALIAGDLIFIGATRDEIFRAFDIETGKQLWSATLPASALATPMTYAIGGRQFVVIAAGGHGKAGVALGDAVVAFALP